MSNLALPRLPDNLILAQRQGARQRMVDSDMYDICNRIKTEVEGGDRLYIVMHEDERGNFLKYTIMEHGDDGVDRLVFQVGPGQRFEALDARVLEHLRYILHVPLSERLKVIEKAEAAMAKEQHEQELEDLYQRVGGPMRHELYRTGFIDSLGTSAPLRNKTARRHRNEGKR